MSFLARLFKPKPNIEKLQRQGNVRALIGVLDRRDDPDSRMKAIAALGTLGDRAAVDPLVAVLRDRNFTEVRIGNLPLGGMLHGAAMTALERIGDARAVDPLISWLDNRSNNVRPIAIRVLGNLKDPRAIPALARALADPDARVSGPAAEALRQIGGPDAERALASH